jgi:membrane-associated phospholipid phosphatase
MQPSRDWWRNAPSAFWSTVLHAAYFSYYVVVPLPIVVFLVTRQREASERYLAAVSATFLACYVVYVQAPVAGPYYEFARPTGEFVTNAPARWVYAGLARGSAYGAAFPSSHVAATVAATIAAWSAAPRLAAVLAVPTALLTVGVVYCQMHYVVDSVAGLAVGVLVPLVVMRTERLSSRS